MHAAPGTRVLFSCRSLDYSASLSIPESPVPHVRIEQMGDKQVEEFLALHNPEHGAALWRQLRGTPQLDLFRSPFYLKLLATQTASDGPALRGRAALFTGFVRQALTREIDAGNLRLRSGALIDTRDYERIIRHEWRDPYELPARGPSLFPALSTLAYGMQERRGAGDESRVRTDYDDALALLGGGARAEDLLRGAVALQVLEMQWDEVFYVHQLLQEYFAARALAAAPQAALARTPWRADEMTPSLDEVLASLADSDPLPAAPATGWEETFVLAAEMQRTPDGFVSALEQVNLPLAGRCAAQPDVAVSPALRQRFQQALLARSRDPEADLRARIAAARALGELGDPRFARRSGPFGEYLLPPLVSIEAGTYAIGNDEGLDQDEAPAHEVTLDAFAMGQFPVTNAEWRCFLEAGGYDEERWWETEIARVWRRGEATDESLKHEWRILRQSWQKNPSEIRESLDAQEITSQQAEQWERLRDLSDDDFESQLHRLLPAGRKTRPKFWDDPAFNHPVQPVVGICWHEARAYCAWLSAQAKHSYGLPTEVQWEAAARGAGGRPYAWGANFDATNCNTFETHVRGTTPVGVFPGGNTPEGLADMTGNVWEWTSSIRRPYDADDGREDAEAINIGRVVRGGSWGHRQIYARGSNRHDSNPDDRNRVIGFRLVCVTRFLPPLAGEGQDGGLAACKAR